jgi:hypothetical protein
LVTGVQHGQNLDFTPYTLVISQIENVPFIVDLPIQNGDFQ